LNVKAYVLEQRTKFSNSEGKWRTKQIHRYCFDRYRSRNEEIVSRLCDERDHRARLPDVRDGLKPVQRRILVAMNDLGLASNRGYRKCAKICGDTPAIIIRMAKQ